MAAVLACGERAVLSHVSAGELWNILRRDHPPSSAAVRPAIPHVTVPGEARSRRGIRVHRSRTLFPGEVTRRAAIPVTTPSRTLTDLRRLLPRQQFAQALRQAEYLGLAIDPDLDPDHTRSELEGRFLALCTRHRLPRPEVNARVGSFIVDFLWRSQRLIVELDGYRAHSGRTAFESDRRRDLQLKRLSYEVVRLASRQVDSEGRTTVSALRKLLGSGRK